MNIQSIRPYSMHQSFKGVERKDDPTVANVALIGGGGRIGKTASREYLLGHFMPQGINSAWDYYSQNYANLNMVEINMGSMGLKNGKTIEDVKDKDLVSVFRNDSIMGKLPDAIKLSVVRKDGDTFLKAESKFGKPELIKLVATRDEVDFSDVNAEILLEATGTRTSRAKLSELKNSTSTAQVALLSAPSKEKDKTVKEMPTVVVGVNSGKIDNIYNEGIGSAASCTTTCIAPVIKLLNDEFGVQSGFINTVHAATATQDIADRTKGEPDSKHRGSFNSIIPTTTGAAKAVGKVLPELNGKLNGQADRVPTTDGSLAVIDLTLDRPTTKEEVLAMFERAAQDPAYKNLIAVADKGSSSIDVVGRHESAMIVPESIMVIGGNRVIVKAYYDNEAGYTRSYMTLASEIADRVIADKLDEDGSRAEDFGNKVTPQGEYVPLDRMPSSSGRVRVSSDPYDIDPFGSDADNAGNSIIPEGGYATKDGKKPVFNRDIEDNSDSIYRDPMGRGELL